MILPLYENRLKVALCRRKTASKRCPKGDTFPLRQFWGLIGDVTILSPADGAIDLMRVLIVYRYRSG